MSTSTGKFIKELTKGVMRLPPVKDFEVVKKKRRKHLLGNVSFVDGGEFKLFFASTSSDNRALKNLLHIVSRAANDNNPIKE